VTLFARTVNPFNRDRTATICIGMYGRGTYGFFRALTDPELRERNTRYLESRFGNSPSYCLVVRVAQLSSRIASTATAHAWQPRRSGPN
jgi:hypothetical protein